MFSLIVFCAAIILLAITVLARVPVHDWWVRACEFPRVQIASLALLTLVCSAWSEAPWQVPSALAALCVVLWQCWRIAPYTRLWPLQVQDSEPGQEERCVTVLISNVLTPNRDAPALIAHIKQHQPDLVLTLESDDWWQQQLDDALADDWPHAVRIPLDNLYGMHLYSRLALEETEVNWLIQDDIPSIHTWLRLKNGERVKFHALHPRPPAPSESEESLWRDAELLLVGKEIHKRDEPTLVAGDLNDVAWSRTTRQFCRVSGMLDARRGRGMFSTFHAHHWFLRWPLDHIFVSEHFTLSHMERLADIGSDHFPILATLCFRPSRADEHENPEADADDWADARETIREGKENTQSD